MDHLEYKNQRHCFKFFTILAQAANNVTTVNFSAEVPFPVKKIKFNFGYTLASTGSPTLLITADICNNDVVGFLNRLNRYDNPLYYAIDGLREDNVIEYLFRDPLQVGNHFVLSVQNLSAAAVTSEIVAHAEFLG